MCGWGEGERGRENVRERGVERERQTERHRETETERDQQRPVSPTLTIVWHESITPRKY